METLRNKQKEMLKMKNTITKKNNVFDGLSSRSNATEKRIGESEHRLMELIKLKCK